MSHVPNILIALSGCFIAAAITVATPMQAGGTQATMPASASRSLLDQHMVLADTPRHEPFTRPSRPVVALVGEGWG
jgi:hypothetical protein